MPRVKFIKQNTEDFIQKIREKTGYNFVVLADLCKIHKHTLSDWKNNKTLISLSAFKKLCKIANIKPPEIIVLPDYWHTERAGKKGGLTYCKKYGNPGTPEGRSRGGKISWQKFISNPKLAKKCNFTLRKNISYPKQSARLAEFIGIILGDGGITKYQVTVSVNKESDKEYINYIENIFEDLFKIKVNKREVKNEKVCHIVASSKNLVEYLNNKHNLKIGDKIRNKIDIPYWIKQKREYSKACLRGLFDTDGCIYVDKHIINGKKYYNPGVVFTSCSKILFQSIEKILKDLNFSPTRNIYESSLFLRREKEIKKFFSEVGSSNPKHSLKFENFLKTHRNTSN